MSQCGHTAAGDHGTCIFPLEPRYVLNIYLDSYLVSLWSPCHDLVSHYPLFDPKPGGPRLCTESNLHDGQNFPLIHEDRSFGENFCTIVAPLLPPEWAANIPKLFPQPYTWQGPECLDASSLASLIQVDRSSEPPLWNGFSAHPILRPLSAGADCQNAVESGQHSTTKHSSFIEESFPLSSNSHCDLRRALARVMASPWKLQNLHEPRQSTLLDFLKYEMASKRWLCCFWTEGTPCSCSFSKKDQAKNHIRFHIKHLPFSCNSRGMW